MHHVGMRALFCALIAAVPGYGQWSWTTLPVFPGAVSTLPRNLSGDRVVGTYRDAVGVWHGYSYDGQEWATIDYPGSTRSSVAAIDGNVLVGSFSIGGTSGAFVHDGTSFSELKHAASVVRPLGIESQTIVGMLDNDGFVYDGVTWTRLAYPGATSTSLEDISGNRMVGVYIDSAREYRGCIYDETGWTSLAYPGASLTWPRGIEGRNIVGSVIVDGWESAFLYDGTSWTTFLYPGSFTTIADAIDGDRVLGTYADANGVHGFVLTLPEPASLLLLCLGAWGVSGRRPRRTR